MRRLPHTRMHVPDSDINVTRLCEVDMGEQVAWSAVLRGAKWSRLGILTNSGKGATAFLADDKAAERIVEMFVRLCRDSDGQPLSDTQVYDNLTDEYEIQEVVRQTTQKGRFLVRYFDSNGLESFSKITVPGLGQLDYQQALHFVCNSDRPPGTILAELWIDGQERRWAPFYCASDNNQ